MTDLGPVAMLLEAEVREKTRRQGIVVWLDPEQLYSEFVDQLIQARRDGQLPYDVCAFRGSFLELLFVLEPLVNGSEQRPLLVHVPGYGRETIGLSPLLEIYEAGTEYQRALPSLVTAAAAGTVRPDQLTAFLAQTPLTLPSANRWLQAMQLDSDDTFFNQLRELSLIALMDDLLNGGIVAGRVGNGLPAILDRLHVLTGLPAERAHERAQPDRKDGQITARGVAFAAASWALSVEYVHDLKRAPRDPRLQAARQLESGWVTANKDLAAHLRRQCPDFYRQVANDTEGELKIETDSIKPEDLGRIDTFWFEEETVLDAALVALKSGRWDQAAEWADNRAGDKSFWLRGDLYRRNTWQLIGDAATLGQAIDRAGMTFEERDSLASAVDRYAELGSAVDRAHRHLEQRRRALLTLQLPEFEKLRDRLDELRVLWREWADSWARGFNRLCVERGFLPEPAYQQRTLFDEVVRPLLDDNDTVVLFLVDALRFEMAQELQITLAECSGSPCELTARLAELPTITSIGMNVLAAAPQRGKLNVAIKNGEVLGVATNQFRVSDPETRKRALHHRSGGQTCPWLSLDEVLNREATSLKQTLGRARLAVVHTSEPDAAGESGVGLAVFEQALQRLRAAWRMLREAGVKRFVITADHGFSLNDETTLRSRPYGKKTEPDRRYVLTPIGADETDLVRVRLRDLDYETDGEDWHLLMPESTAVFDQGQKLQSFVHGGNSLQERVIPVLTVLHKAAIGTRLAQFTVTAKQVPGVLGLHCLQGMVSKSSQRMLEFSGSSEVELGLRVVDAVDVQVELCETRGGAQRKSGLVVATVGESFELFFRLSGTSDARVLVELHHLGTDASIAPCVLEERFDVTVTGRKAVASKPSLDVARTWLQQLPEGGVRVLFEHIEQHGSVTEAEAVTMLGGQREVRKFSREFDALAKLVPFNVKVDNASGLKRWQREA